MRSSIEVKNLAEITFRKHFTDDDLFTAQCIGLKIENHTEITADIRKVCKNALWKFMNSVFPGVMIDPSANMVAFRKSLFANIKVMYEKSWEKFNATYNPYGIYDHLGKKLWEHQAETLWDVEHRQHNLVCFEQGLGKSCLSATMSKIFQIRRTVIVGPSLVKWNWVHDLSDDWGYNQLFFTVLDRKKTMKAYMTERFVILNYEMINKFFDYLEKDEVGHIVIDECHYTKNTSSNRSKGVAKLIKRFPNARVTLLTGTPVTNRITDMFAYFKLTGHPLGKNFAAFKKKYARGRTKVVGVKNVDDLILKMSNFMIRKKSSECMDLPELRIKKYYFQMDEYQDEYNKAIDELYEKSIKFKSLTKEIERLESTDRTESQNKELHMLNQQKNEIRTSRNSNINTLNRIVSLSKIPNIIKLIDNLNEQDEKVIVFCSYKDPLQKLKNHYKDSAVLIDGSVSAHKRQQSIEQFKKDPKTKVFIGQNIAAGIGINLVNSSKVIFCNFPYTPDQLEQPYKRAHRGGQTKDVDVMFTICEGTIDEHIYQILTGKMGDINDIVDSDKSGNVDYGSIQDQLFSNLIKEYEKKKGIKSEEVNNFQIV